MAKPNKRFEPTAQKLRFWVPCALRRRLKLHVERQVIQNLTGRYGPAPPIRWTKDRPHADDNWQLLVQ